MRTTDSQLSRSDLHAEMILYIAFSSVAHLYVILLPQNTQLE
jgi:hypothetical protein